MLVYRIALSKYSGSLTASGRAARWNPNDTDVIYTSSSRALACLENIVHRSQYGLNMLFSVMIIDVPDKLAIQAINLNDLPADWKEFYQIPLTQRLGEKWLAELKAPILQVPSSIIDEEVNFLLNPRHPYFKLIKLKETIPFTFDKRIKEL